MEAREKTAGEREEAVGEREIVLAEREIVSTERERALAAREAAAKKPLPTPAPGSTLAALLTMYSPVLASGAPSVPSDTSMTLRATGVPSDTSMTLRATGVL